VKQVLIPLLAELNVMREKTGLKPRRNENHPKTNGCQGGSRTRKIGFLAKRNKGLATKDDGLPRSNGGLSKKIKAGLKKIEATVDVFEETLGIMDTTILRPIEKSRRV
jgi:hypothetical protein